MKYLNFDQETEFLLTLKFRKDFSDPVDRHRAAMAFISKSLGCRPFEVIVVNHRSTKNALHIVFKKNEIYDTKEGTEVELYSYCSADGFDLKGVVKKGNVIAIEIKNDSYVLWANCQDSCHDPLCARFLSTKTINPVAEFFNSFK